MQPFAVAARSSARVRGAAREGQTSQPERGDIPWPLAQALPSIFFMFVPLAPKGIGLQPSIAVLVVDDQSAVREGVARLLACGSLPVRAVTTAATGAEALDLAARTRPDIVVLDADLSGEDGLALIPLLRGYSQVMVLTSHGDACTRARAQQLGALAFIEKHEPAAALLASIARIAHLNVGGDQSPKATGADSCEAAGASSAAPAMPRP